jgi:hypothetical protein
MKGGLMFRAWSAVLTANRFWQVLVLLTMSSLQGAAQSQGDRETDFKIVLEQRNEKPDGYRAIITTTSTYPCEGYSLRLKVQWENDTVSVLVLGMLRPTPCVQSSAEASGSAFIGDLRQGVSFFRVRYRGDVDLYKVIRTGSRVKLHPIHARFTELKGN